MTTIFNPMSQKPIEDESDTTFSITVLIFNQYLKFVAPGYYDFEEQEWSHFGENSNLLKCWCYIPMPENNGDLDDWETIKPKSYRKFF